MQVTQVGRYRCICSWELKLNPESGNILCDNQECDNFGKEFTPPVAVLVEAK
jgi:hypothetical protein